MEKRIKNNQISKRSGKKELTSSDPHTEAVATVQMINVALLEVTAHASAPTATDVKSFRLKPTRVIVRIPAMVEHPWTWRSAVDEPPQETVLTNGMLVQKTPRLGAAEAHISDGSHGGVGVQVVSLEEPVPRMASVCEERCGLMMLRERAVEWT